MSIGMIGEGAIGSYVAAALTERDLAPAVTLVRPAKLNADTAARVGSVADLPKDITLMVDCAGHEALRAYGADILARGIDLVTLSLGALADDALKRDLEQAAAQSGAQLVLASGAIGALDCLNAAQTGGLTQVTYTGRKPPKGWMGSPAEDSLDLAALTQAEAHFEGSAREAALRYPKNANVAAAVALAGLGFDQTQVRLIADPDIQSNMHSIEATGAFGSFTFSIEGKALPDNPRSSALAAMSTVAAVQKRRAPISL